MMNPLQRFYKQLLFPLNIIQCDYHFARFYFSFSFFTLSLAIITSSKVYLRFIYVYSIPSRCSSQEGSRNELGTWE